MPAKPQIFTIPIGTPFADALAEQLIAETGTDRLALARGLILLPTNRAIQAIRDAFVRRAEPGLLLPRLVAIGDPDIDEAIGAALDPMAADPPPPAIPPLQRQIALARLVQTETGVGAAEAMRLARELGRTRDQLLIEGVEPAKLRKIGNEALASHWQSSLRQLNAMLTAWPRVLEASGQIDLAERRNLLLGQLADRWRRNPPPGFVVAAGIDSAAPAIAGLLRTVARLPQGRVVFAGLDCEMDDAQWEEIGGEEGKRPLESHPQFHLGKLLAAIGAGRGEVRPWPGSSDTRRAAFVSRAFATPRATALWETLSRGEKSAPGLAALALETAAQEAQAIAIALREAVETPGKTAALITPDRDLATRVSALLARWGIVADDSAGRPLSATPPGALILALAQAWAEEFAPAPLMALLKHPLAGGADEARLGWLEGARALDLALRGPRPAPGLAGMSAHLAEGDKRTERIRRAASKWWDCSVRQRLEPLEAAERSPETMLRAIAGAATALAGESVWAGQEGRALGELIAQLETGFAAHPLTLEPAALPHLLRDALSAVAIRPQPGGHPRIAILGLIEARLQTADFVILSGLNEGVWPATPAPDPWLAPQIRAELKLPGIERRIGLAAHDLASALGGRRVLLTRARRDARAPTIASRFWLRLQTMTGGLPPPETSYGALATALDRHEGLPDRAKRPRPAPPAAERPKSLWVTDADRMMADPYAFYARAMLGLSKLDPLDAEPDAAWRGSIVHAVLDAWAKEDDCKTGALVARMRGALDGAAVHPLTRTLWLPRLVEAAQWIEEEVAALKAEGREPALTEGFGESEFAGVTIKARADRIDRLADGSLAIVDYKTGEPPKFAQVAAGLALQLGLTGLIAERGGFTKIGGGSASAFEYWSLARDTDRSFGKIVSPCKGRKFIPAEDFVATIAGMFRQAAEELLTGDAPFTAKLHPEYAWTDYDQLMRLEEWEGRDV